MAKRKDGDTSFFREAAEAGSGYVSGMGLQPAMDVMSEDLSELVAQYHVEDLPILAACMNAVAAGVMNVARRKSGEMADAVYRVAHTGMQVTVVPKGLADMAEAAGGEVSD